MAFKNRKIPKKGKKEKVSSAEKLSVNRIERLDNDGPLSVNLALEEERAEKSQAPGKTLPVSKNNMLKALEISKSDNANAAQQSDGVNTVGSDLAFSMSNNEENLDTINKNEIFRLDESNSENDRRQTINKGKNLPPAKELRDTNKDETPISEDDLGLPEDSYLLKRKVSKKELMLQNETQKKQFLGTNVRKVRDFISIFDKGFSNKTNPKVDLNYEIAQNPVLRKELIAQQLLRNYKSDNQLERRNTKQIFDELNLSEQEGFIDKIEETESIHTDTNFISKIVEKLPSV